MFDRLPEWMKDPVEYELWQMVQAEQYRRFVALYGAEFPQFLQDE